MSLSYISSLLNQEINTGVTVTISASKFSTVQLSKLRFSTFQVYRLYNCNEWKTDKRHEFTIMGKLKTTRVMMATVRHVTFTSELRKFQAAWFLFERGYNKNNETTTQLTVFSASKIMIYYHIHFYLLCSTFRVHTCILLKYTF
jgi:hypothetical protein